MTFTEMVNTLPIKKTKHSYRIGNWLHLRKHMRSVNKETGEVFYGCFNTLLIEKNLINVDEMIIKHYG